MKKTLFISADGFEDLELLVPFYRMKEANFHVDVASMHLNPIKGKHGYEVAVNRTLADINPDEYDLLVLPGGKAPERVRQEQKALEIVQRFFEMKKPIAAICHGPQILISAGVMRGRQATCYREVAPELREAGVQYEDREVVVDANLITSREPSDLPAFMREIFKMIQA